jgi:cytochrome c peroxidase
VAHGDEAPDLELTRGDAQTLTLIMRGSALAIGALAILTGCHAVDRYRAPVPLGLDLIAPVPVDKPLTRERVALGRKLFFDPVMSSDDRVSCASCHRPDHAFSDTLALSLGVHARPGRRNAPSLLNAVYGTTFAWDGRAPSLESQVLLPIQDSAEMNLPLVELENRVRAQPAYTRAFRREFGEDPTPRTIALALASYVRTLRSGDAPIDRFRAGDTLALSPLARFGGRVFSGKANCTTCHVGPLFTDGAFHNTGIAWRDSAFSDIGRANSTGLTEDKGRFKTPSLRNVAVTAPYMHDGSVASLAEVVEFYEGGGRSNPGLDPVIRPLRLTADEKTAIVAFLESLTARP